MDDRLANLEKINQEFNSLNYAERSLDSYLQNIQYLYLNNLVTPYYLRNQKFIETEGKVILDAGCGTGYKTLALAEANPGAKIVGIDLSPEAIELARQRFADCGCKNAEFYALSIEDLPDLGQKFDYINNDEVLYFLPDPLAALQAMKSVLKPDGIIRTNLKSSLQRTYFYRVQEVLQMLGLNDRPQASEIEQARHAIDALKDEVLLKTNTWPTNQEADPEWLASNYFNLGKGYTVTEMFSLLKAADLEFISMVNWSQWELLDLFIEPDNLPMFLAMSLPGLSMEERLHLFELFHPIHELLDFWCGHSDVAGSIVPVADWTDLDWQGALVHLHPQMRETQLQEKLIACAARIESFPISACLPFVSDPSLLMDSAVATCIIPTLSGPKSMLSLVEHWLRVRPLQIDTLQPQDPQQAFETVKQILTALEQIGYVLLERPSVLG